MGDTSRIDAMQAARQAAIEAARRAAEAAQRAAQAAARAQQAQQRQALNSKKGESDLQQNLIKSKLQNQPINGQTSSEFQARQAADQIADDYRIRTTPQACEPGQPSCGDPFNDGLTAQEGTAKKIRELTQNQTPEVAALTLKYAQPTIDAIAARLGATAKDEDGAYGDDKPRFDNVVSDLAVAANRAYTAPEGKAVVEQMARSIVENIDANDIGRFDEALVKPVKSGVGRELSAEVVRQLQAAGRNDQADDILQNVEDDAGLSVAEFNQTDGKPLDAARVQQLALKNAPILVLPKSYETFERRVSLENNPSYPIVSPFGMFNPSVKLEKVPNKLNLPADPLEYIKNSRLRENVELGVTGNVPDFSNPFPVAVNNKDKSLGDNTDDDPNNNFGPEALRTAGENDFLDLDNSQRRNIGSTDAPIFYQFERAKYDAAGNLKEPPKLTYHVFYAFNNGPTPVGKVTDVGDHEGDWERITYELNPTTFEPENIIPSAHNGSSAPTPFPENGRPKIYVADGSHANYVAPGEDYKTEAPGTYDKTAIDRNGDNVVDESDDAVIFDTSRNLKEVTSQLWYPEPGSKGVRFGEISAPQNTDLGFVNDLYPSGPQGPSYDKGAVE